MIKKSKVKSQKSKLYKGQVMIIAIIFLAVILILASALFGRVADFVRFGSNSIINEQATNLAEAGIDYAIWQLNKTPGSCPSPNFCGSEHTLGTTGSFIVTIQDKTSSLKTITSTGYIPNSTTPRAKRTIKADVMISNEILAFNYAVQVGIGGISITGSAINGNVYSNKPGTGSIYTNNSGSHIYGDAYMVGTLTQDQWEHLVTGETYENQPPSVFPTFDYSTWQLAAAAGGTTTCTPTCTIKSWPPPPQNIGPQKYDGNLTITNNVSVEVSGPIYITGNLTLNPGKLVTDDSLGSTGTVIIVEGTINLTNGAQILANSANPKGYLLLATKSTSSSAIPLDGGVQSTIFYALEGGITVTHGTKVTASIAKTLTISGGSTFEYDEGLASTQLSGGPGGSWQIKKGTYRFTSSP